MIEITLNQIKESAPCRNGWKKVVAANGGTHCDCNKPFPMSSLLDSNNFEDTVWAMRCVPKYDKVWTEFAFWVGGEVLKELKDSINPEAYNMIKRGLEDRNFSGRREATRLCLSQIDNFDNYTKVSLIERLTRNVSPWSICDNILFDLRCMDDKTLTEMAENKLREMLDAPLISRLEIS